MKKLGVLLLALVVFGGIAWGWRDYQSRIDEQRIAVPAARSTMPDVTPVSLWVGDSYTAGTGAESPSRAESCATSREFGWACNVDAEGGTGFVSAGTIKGNQPLPKRLDETAERYLADVILIDAGRNDKDEPWPEVEAAASDYLADLHEAYPDALMVAISPYYLGRDEAPLPEYPTFIAEQMRRYGGEVIDPSGWASAGQARLLPDGVHPNQAGHDWIAANLASALRDLGVPEQVEKIAEERVG